MKKIILLCFFAGYGFFYLFYIIYVFILFMKYVDWNCILKLIKLLVMFFAPQNCFKAYKKTKKIQPNWYNEKKNIIKVHLFVHFSVWDQVQLTLL